MTFFTFKQNNSGGWFTGPAIAVCIEAETKDEAVTKAESIGLYFDGNGDCSCCGDRWSTYTDDGSEPLLYGNPLREYDGGFCGGEVLPWKIYFADGRIEDPIANTPASPPKAGAPKKKRVSSRSSKGNRPAAEVRLDPLEVSALRHIIHAQSPLEDTVGGLLRTVPQSHFKELSLDVLARKLGEWTPADGEPVRSLMGE